MCGVLLLTVLLAHAEERKDILIADFEGDDYGAWKVTGTAFGKGPARGTLPNQMPVTGFIGKGLVNSYHGGDDSTGTLTSPEFTIERMRINFLIGGGNHPGKACINLLVGGKVVHTATGKSKTPQDTEHLSWHSWDVTEFASKKATIEIVDNAKGGWGHINIDHILMTDRNPPDERDDMLARAEESVKKAVDRARADPNRPVYHFAPPALWMNDPNGPIFYKGQYHLFYQHNPYGDGWGHMHWGHARSKDLVHWEHLSIALWPSRSRGEEHVFSGCAAVTPEDKLMLIYTSIGNRPPEQWGALSEDPEATRFRKHPGNPLLTLKDHGDVQIDDWRDPFVFKDDGKWYMVCGGHRKGAKGCINLYQSVDLVKWKYLGIPFEGKENNWECPLLFRLGDKWVLIYSPHGAVRYYSGSLELKAVKYKPDFQGTLDPGNFYAPNVLADDKGRRVLWGWVNGFPEGRGWNGCLTLPRELTLAADGSLVQKPAPELEKLRGQHIRGPKVQLASTVHGIPGLKGDTLELRAEFELEDAKAFGLNVRRSTDGKKAVRISYDGTQLDVAGSKAALKLAEGQKKLTFHVFLDRSVVEVYADDGRAVVTKVIQAGKDDLGVDVFATDGGTMLDRLDVWEMKPIWR
jgi:beta-fructofuranosidase